MTYKLHKLDLDLHPRHYLDNTDHCYYFLEKEAEGYTKSQANNLIHNFKKPVDRRGRPEWRYKIDAIQKFINMLCEREYQGECITIVPAPTSKPRGHEEWDDRIDQVVDGLRMCQPELNIEKILDTTTMHTPAHIGGSRNLSEIKSHTISTPLKNCTSGVVILVDDVLTTGAHFKAWKEMILRSNPDIKNVLGLFLSLHMW